VPELAVVVPSPPYPLIGGAVTLETALESVKTPAPRAEVAWVLSSSKVKAVDPSYTLVFVEVFPKSGLAPEESLGISTESFDKDTVIESVP